MKIYLAKDAQFSEESIELSVVGGASCHSMRRSMWFDSSSVRSWGNGMLFTECVHTVSVVGGRIRGV